MVGVMHTKCPAKMTECKKAKIFHIRHYYYYFYYLRAIRRHTEGKKMEKAEFTATTIAAPPIVDILVYENV